jgi:ATP-dependent DNA helicase RecQ
VAQRGHDRLSTFGIGADLSEQQWRSVLRQLISLGHLQVEGEFSTLSLADSARTVLRGEVPLLLRVPVVAPRAGARSRAARASRDKLAPVPLDNAGLARFAALKAWRAEVAREHNLPAFVIFHDATLAQMAQQCPRDLDALAGISGVGAKKLQAYGAQILRVLQQAA